MDQFSIFKYENLSEELKKTFNKELILRLSSFQSEMKKDDVLGSLSIEHISVTDLYSKITGGIQVGSGNQELFLSVLNVFVEAWDKTIK